MISIVIPLYNKENYIRKCILSVLAQTYTNFEVVVVNDGSTDKSVEIVKSIEDNRIRIINQKNGGPSSARNTGVREAQGEWIVFLDADDLFLPYALEYFDEMIQKHPKYVYYCANYFMQTDGKLFLFSYRKFEGEVPNNFFYEFTNQLTDRAGSAIYKRDIIIQHPFNEQLRRYEDAEAQYKLLNKYKVYQSWIPVMISNRDASTAAAYRKNIEEDFIGHLVFDGKSFWEKMQLVKLGSEIFSGYPTEINRYKEIHNNVYRHLLFLNNITVKILSRIKKRLNPINCAFLTETQLLSYKNYKGLIK